MTIQRISLPWYVYVLANHNRAEIYIGVAMARGLVARRTARTRERANSWLYQLSQRIKGDHWSPAEYRLRVWEGEKESFTVGEKMSRGENPKPGDVVVFFYAKSHGDDGGFYGWAIILDVRAD